MLNGVLGRCATGERRQRPARHLPKTHDRQTIALLSSADSTEVLASASPSSSDRFFTLSATRLPLRANPSGPWLCVPALRPVCPYRGCRGGRPLLRAGPFGKALHKMCRKELAAGKPTRDRPRGRSRRDVRDYVRLCYRNIRSTSRGVKSPALTILKLFSSGCVQAPARDASRAPCYLFPAYR